MAGPRREMRAVELVEADAFDDDALDDALDDDGRAREPVGATPAPVRRARSAVARRRSRAPALVALAVVALLAVGGSVLGDRREDERLRSIAGRPGVVAPLEEPLVELWRGRGWTGSELRDVGGRLVGVVSTPYGSVDVVALDPRTGADVWRTPVGPAAPRDLWTRCVVPGAPYPTVPPDADPVAVCVAVDATTTTHQSALGTLTYPTSARLVVVDAVDGSVLRDVPVPPTSQVAALGDDVVLAHVEPDGRARVARVDARTGVERWSTTAPDRVPADVFGQRSVVLQVAGDVVALDAGPTRVLSADGDPLRTWPGPPPPGLGTPLDLLAGGRVLARTGVAADGGWGTEVVDLDTGTSWSAAGFPVRVRPDDGSLDDLVLLQADGFQTLLAHDRATGDLRWTLDSPYSVPVAVVGGRVVAVDGDVLRAVDGRTGAPLWTSTLARPAQGAVVTDGRVLVVGTSGAGGGGVLTAVGVPDGRTRWTTRLEHAPFLFAVDGRPYGWSGRGLLAFGSPSGPG